MYDVAVIGGGPVGSQVAYRLATLGYRVVVIEQKATLGEPVCCTGIVSEECVRAFGIEESIIHRHANSARVYSPSGRSIHLLRDEMQAAIVDRQALNVSMARRAQRHGAEYLLGSCATDLAVSPHAASVTTIAGINTRQITAKTIVIATGFSTQLCRKVGLRPPDCVTAGAQAEVETPTRGVDEIEVYLGAKFAPGFFAWLVPTAPSKALAGLLTRHAPQNRLNEFLSFMATKGTIVSSAARVMVSAVTLRPPPRTYGRRLLVVGTAAGQVKPITGGGIYYGLLCADMAAETLDRALKEDDLSSKSLSEYQRKWTSKLGDEFRTGYRARRLYECLSDTRIDRSIDVLQSSGAISDLLKSDEAHFDWHGRSLKRLLRTRTLARLVKEMIVSMPGKNAAN